MRTILTLMALASIPAFCQDSGPKLKDMVPHPLRVTVGPPGPQLCSIPLLNATTPGKPVPMPTLKPRSKIATPRLPNGGNIDVPAPACHAPAAAPKP